MTKFQNTKSFSNPPFIGDQLANDLPVTLCPVAHLREPDRVVRPPSPRAVAMAQKMLQQFGQRLPLLIDENHKIIVGLEFYLAAKALSLATLKVIKIDDLSVDEKRALTIALHRLSELSLWDDKVLAEEMKDLSSLNLDFDLGDVTGFTIGEMDVLFDKEAEDKPCDPIDQLPDVETLHPVTQLGDLWHLDRHRALCGDALDAGCTAKLMSGKLASMVLTDPPYNIPISDNVSDVHDDFQMGVGEKSRDEFIGFLGTPLMLLMQYLVDGALLFMFMDRRHVLEAQTAGENSGLSLFDLAIWNKMSGGMGSFYRSQHEPCLIFKHGKAPHRNNIELGRHGRYRSNVWSHRGFSSFGKDRKEALASHPTVKPVALLAEAIKDCTKKGELVLDPFLGSGSTILAAEKTGRTAYGIELEPKYVDVSVLRWQKMTGKKAVLDATGESFDDVAARRAGAIAQRPTGNSGQV